MASIQQVLSIWLSRMGLSTISLEKIYLRLLPTFRVGIFKIDVWGNLIPFQSKRHFDNASQTRCSLRMTNIGFNLIELTYGQDKNNSK